ncbi:MAG: hypothetical protein ABIH34_01425 [Nanoarchaeota archaeon]
MVKNVLILDDERVGAGIACALSGSHDLTSTITHDLTMAMDRIAGGQAGLLLIDPTEFRNRPSLVSIIKAANKNHVPVFLYTYQSEAELASGGITPDMVKGVYQKPHMTYIGPVREELGL